MNEHNIKIIEQCGVRLKYLLEVGGISQRKLGRAVNIPFPMINQYCNGTRCPKMDKVFIIAKYLGVNEMWLMGYDVPMQDTNGNECDLEKGYILMPVQKEYLGTFNLLNKLPANKLKKVNAIITNIIELKD